MIDKTYKLKALEVTRFLKLVVLAENGRNELLLYHRIVKIHRHLQYLWKTKTTFPCLLPADAWMVVIFIVVAFFGEDKSSQEMHEK